MSENPLLHRQRIRRAGFAPHPLPLVLLPLLVAPLLLLTRTPLLAAMGASTPAATTEPPALHLVVNIPAYRLDVFESGRLTASFPVTVGKITDPTPDGHFELQRVVWNPWWRPPFYRKPKDRDTPPGPRNPMGKVKLFFSKLYYLHGTAKDAEIGSPASRGCIRLHNADAVALATLVHRHAAPLPEAKLQSLASTRSWVTHEYLLRDRIPLDIRYDLAEVRDGKLVVYPDLYRQSRETLAQVATRALLAAGYPLEELDAEALQRAVAAPARGGIPIDALTGAGATPAAGEAEATAAASAGGPG
jgi:hypothetical protein